MVAADLGAETLKLAPLDVVHHHGNLGLHRVNDNLMSEQRNWRDAKIPQWVRDAIDAEQEAARIRAALSWPTEARPTPLLFRWGGYGVLTGTPIAGVYYDENCRKLHIKPHDEPKLWSKWQFSTDGEKWSDNNPRGPLFATKREAVLNRLWNACEKAARDLDAIRKAL